MTALAFDNFANQRTQFGTVEEINAVTAAEVDQFYKTNYTPSSAGLALVGDFDPGKARELIRKYCEPIPPRAVAPVPDIREPGRPAEKREVLTDPGIQTSEVLIAWRIPGVLDPDWFAVKRLSEVLGTDDAARLPTSLVNSAGVASSIAVNLEDSVGPNLLTAQIIVAPGKDPAQAEKLVYDEIERIAREGVSPEELARVSADALRRRAFTLLTTANRAVVLSGFLIGYGQLDMVNQWERGESRLMGDDVRRMAQKYFAPSNRTVLIVNPGPGGRL
jgi:predicted Zn-dependent peptidase